MARFALIQSSQDSPALFSALRALRVNLLGLPLPGGLLGLRGAGGVVE